MKIIKNISFYLVISICICALSLLLDSYFLFEYLRENIIGLQVTLLAINTATLGLIASKIQDISLKFKIDFSATIKEMKFSLKEQIVLIASSIIVLIFHYSSVLNFPYKEFIANTVLCSIFIYSIYILWDTGKSVFVIIDELQELDSHKKP